MMEKAQTYGAHSVFFEAGGAGAPPLAGALASAGAAGAFAAVGSPLAGDAARTKTQSPLPSEEVVSLLFGLLRRGQVTLRRLVGWQDRNSLKSQAAVWQPGYSTAQLAHSDAKLLFHNLTDTTRIPANSFARTWLGYTVLLFTSTLQPRTTSLPPA